MNFFEAQGRSGVQPGQQILGAVKDLAAIQSSQVMMETHRKQQALTDLEIGREKIRLQEAQEQQIQDNRLIPVTSSPTFLSHGPIAQEYMLKTAKSQWGMDDKGNMKSKNIRLMTEDFRQHPEEMQNYVSANLADVQTQLDAGKKGIEELQGKLATKPGDEGLQGKLQEALKNQSELGKKYSAEEAHGKSGVRTAELNKMMNSEVMGPDGKMMKMSEVIQSLPKESQSIYMVAAQQYVSGMTDKPPDVKGILEDLAKTRMKVDERKFEAEQNRLARESMERAKIESARITANASLTKSARHDAILKEINAAKLEANNNIKDLLPKLAAAKSPEQKGLIQRAIDIWKGVGEKANSGAAQIGQEPSPMPQMPPDDADFTFQNLLAPKGGS